MPQRTATVGSLPKVFGMVEAMRAGGPDWAPTPIGIIRGGMAGDVDRRNGTHRRGLTGEGLEMVRADGGNGLPATLSPIRPRHPRPAPPGPRDRECPQQTPEARPGGRRTPPSTTSWMPPTPPPHAASLTVIGNPGRPRVRVRAGRPSNPDGRIWSRRGLALPPHMEKVPPQRTYPAAAAAQNPACAAPASACRPGSAPDGRYCGAPAGPKARPGLGR